MPFPLGYTPVEAISEEDYQYNLGVQFKLAGWDVDAGGSYGKDMDQVYTLNSANSSLFVDTHTTPTNFYDGSFVASEFLGNIDATHQYNVGMASPLNVAIGVEAREDYYAIKAGDPASRYKEGPQAYPGFQPSDASAHSRKNYATYIDFAVAPIETLPAAMLRAAMSITPISATPRSARSRRAMTSARNWESAAPSPRAFVLPPWKRNSIPPPK